MLIERHSISTSADLTITSLKSAISQFIEKYTEPKMFHLTTSVDGIVTLLELKGHEKCITHIPLYFDVNRDFDKCYWELSAIDFDSEKKNIIYSTGA